MKKLLLLQALFLPLLALTAADLVIADNGKSAYSIVIQSQNADSLTQRSAKLLAEQQDEN